MSAILKKHTWLRSRSELPGRLEIDRLYFIASEGVFVVDHGAGPVQFGGGGGGQDRGTFESAAALRAAYPTDVLGAWATVIETGTIWIWNGTGWADTGKNMQVEVVDDLVTPDPKKALSARQGVVLNQEVQDLIDSIISGCVSSPMTTKDGVEMGTDSGDGIAAYYSHTGYAEKATVEQYQAQNLAAITQIQSEIASGLAVVEN